MSLIVLAILSLTIAIAMVSSYDCRCEQTLASNDFYGNHNCFTAYYKIEQHLNNKYYIDDINKEIDTLCNGKCGEAANRVLYYRDRTRFRQVGCLNFKYMYYIYCLYYVVRLFYVSSL